MKTVPAFFKLIRWPNLLFIVLTQVLFYYLVFGSVQQTPHFAHALFAWLVLASVLIAAAGYIINDYFDLHIDVLNKPQKVVIDNSIKRRWAIVLHLVLSAAGVAISFYVSYKTRVLLIGPANLLSVFLLWFYSTTFKCKPLVGNVLIALLTAWVIFVIYFFTGADFLKLTSVPFNEQKLFKLAVVYAGFAFITTLLREAVKDLEDMAGDAALKCRTMPLAWGVPATKMYAFVWLVVTVSSLVILMIYALQSGWWLFPVYVVPLIIYPLVRFFFGLRAARQVHDYHRLSNLIKFVMLTGILSMAFFAFLRS